MKKFLSLSLLLAAGSIGVLKAQSYKAAAGVRLGVESGISLKYFMKENVALEGLLTATNRTVEFTGLYEIQKAPVFAEANLNWFFGGGAHIGSYRERTDHEEKKKQEVSFGIDGIIGLEYILDKLPMTIGLDWKPELNFAGRTGLYGDNVALTVRYVF